MQSFTEILKEEIITEKSAIIYREVDGKTFSSVINKLPKDKKIFVTTYSATEYDKMKAKLYLSQNDQSGFVIKSDGELISVFSLPGAKQGKEAIKAAIGLGAKRIDYLDGFLGEFYNKMGFKEKSRMKWDDQYAPKGWDYKKYGRPDVVFAEI